MLAKGIEESHRIREIHGLILADTTEVNRWVFVGFSAHLTEGPLLIMHKNNFVYYEKVVLRS